MKNIVSYFDRNFNLIFNRGKCEYIRGDYEYNEVIIGRYMEYRFLGGGWAKEI